MGPVFAVDVLTWHNDLARTGQNLNETILTPANVNSIQFGKLFVINTDGQVYAQPLYVSSLTIPGKGIRNVVYIASEHDTVYACDADSGAMIWQVSLLKQGEATSDDHNCNSQISPEIGVTATPVIDRSVGPHGTIYVVAMSKLNTSYFQRIHALDLATGAEEFDGPVDIAATYPGTGTDSVDGTLPFDPKQYKNRAGLLLSNGIVYTTWASHCDNRPYTSWIIGYDANSLARARVFNLTPNGTDGAIWGSGAAPAVDDAGNIFTTTGNGTFETSLNANGFPSMSDFGNCFVKISTQNETLAVADYWTMFNTVTESSQDKDLNSGGLVLLPDMMDEGGMVRHLAVGGGKDKHLYIVDRDNMGKFHSSSNATVYQDLTSATTNGLFATPAYFDGTLYVGGVSDTLKAYRFTNARLGATPTSVTSINFSFPGTTPSISANGTTNAIVWAAYKYATVPGVLLAYDATNLGHLLYSSEQAANGRDNFGLGNKFVVPTVANGKVYVGAKASVGVFGLLNSPTPTPTATPTPTSTPTPTVTPSPTPTPTPTPAPTSTPTPTPTATATATPTPVPTPTPSSSSTPKPTPSPGMTPNPRPSSIPKPSPSIAPSVTPRPSSTPK